NYLDAQAKKGKSIGFVPTMGALHQGHISLIEACKKENSITVSSIFVNPAQFNDPKDFNKYPVTIEQDIEMLETAGCDALLLPSVVEIYPDGQPRQHYELGHLENLLEGKFRPGHFQGVCMVMHRLLDIVKPGNLYLGQKDCQQCMVIIKLIELIGMNGSVKVNICPTLREPDGLAMSSRNLRLNEEERKRAATIFMTLCFIKDNLDKKNINQLLEQAIAMLNKKGFKVDYAIIVNAKTLEPIEVFNKDQKMVALIAAFINEIRLIDNLPLN
ncbi:MAG TPA: pantoate--beta-alanine ligase, partial [Chitinophagaceae bacterium]